MCNYDVLCSSFKQEEPKRQGLVYEIMVLVGFVFNPIMTDGISHKDSYNKSQNDPLCILRGQKLKFGNIIVFLSL